MYIKIDDTKKPIINPYVGEAIPELPPLNTGSPRLPISTYSKIIIILSKPGANNIINIIPNTCIVIGDAPIGIDIHEHTTSVDSNNASYAIFFILNLFIDY